MCDLLPVNHTDNLTIDKHTNKKSHLWALSSTFYILQDCRQKMFLQDFNFIVFPGCFLCPAGMNL